MPHAIDPDEASAPPLPPRWTIKQLATDLASHFLQGRDLRQLHHHQPFSKTFANVEALEQNEITALFTETVRELDKSGQEDSPAKFWLQFTALFDTDRATWHLVHATYLQILAVHASRANLPNLFSDAIRPLSRLEELQDNAVLSIALGILTEQEFVNRISFANTFSVMDVISTLLEEMAGAGARIMESEAQVSRYEEEMAGARHRIMESEAQVSPKGPNSRLLGICKAFIARLGQIWRIRQIGRTGRSRH